MQRTRRDLIRSIGAGTVALGTAGVGVTAANGPARVRVLHASPDAPNVDVFVDGTEVLSDVPFKTISGYLELPAGSYDIDVAPAGAGIGSAVIQTTVTLSADTDYTIAAINTLSNIAATVFVDDNTPGEFNAKPRVRAIHLSPDAPAVDLAVTDGPRIPSGGVVAAQNLSYQEETGYLELLPTEYSFEIRQGSLLLETTTLFSFDAEFAPQATYTAFAVGLLNPDTDDEAFDIVLAEDVPSPRSLGRGDSRGTGGRDRGRGSGESTPESSSGGGRSSGGSRSGSSTGGRSRSR